MIRIMGTTIQLVPPMLRHADYLFENRNDWQVRRWCRQEGLIMLQEHLAWMDSLVGDKTRRMYVIEVEGNPCGMCGLTSIDHLHRRAEFSCWIAPDQRRKGLARRVLIELFSHGFRDLNLNRIWGETFEGNPAAKLFEEIGMKREGTRMEFYFKDGRFINAHLYSIGVEEWSE